MSSFRRPFSASRRSVLFATFGLTCSAVLGCGAEFADDAESQDEAVTVDSSRKPQTVKVPVYFTKNTVADVGYCFVNSGVPFTDEFRKQFDPSVLATATKGIKERVLSFYEPGRAGAGYATATFVITIPYASDGRLAYSLAQTRLESEVLDMNIVTLDVQRYRHSPLRLRAGANTPAIAVALTGSQEGKLVAKSLPFTDEGFTERDWKAGALDSHGRPIKRVAVGSLRLTPVGSPAPISGGTRITPGVGAGSAFIMVDKTNGESAADGALIHVNLLENDRGEVTVGATFSTNGGVLSPQTKAKFDERLKQFRDAFKKELDYYTANPTARRKPHDL